MSTTIDLSQEACDERLRAALVYVTEHPETWDQQSWGYALDGVYPTWECGTKACLAGRGAVLAGLAELQPGVEVSMAPLWINEAGQELMLESGIREREGAEHLYDALTRDFTSLGAVLFGLTRFQASLLFDSDNSLEQLWGAAASLTDGRVQATPEQLQAAEEIDRRQEVL